MDKNKPINILWIQTDEQRADSVGCYGNSWVKTPNLDHLAKTGTIFKNHHVQSPVCVANRVCELTSCYPHQTGILNNNVHYNMGKWPQRLRSFPELFADEGYATANFGKYHTPHHHTWLENWHFELFTQEATHSSLGSQYDEDEHDVIARPPYRTNSTEVIFSGKYPHVKGGRTPTSHITDNAIDWLRGYQHIRRPFLLRVSFLAPHTPVLPPGKFYKMYDPENIDWDKPDEQILRSRPSYELNSRNLNNFKGLTDEEIKLMHSSYYGLVSHVDEQVGRLIKALDQLGELDNTLIIFTADHGTLIGEYGQFQKGMFYDLVTRVPCIFSGPGIPEQEVINHLTETIDLGPTLLKIAGINKTHEMEGKDLFGKNEKEDVIGEYYINPSSVWERRSWIRTEKWSLDYTSEINEEKVYNYEKQDGKLIDMEKDPLAHRNLYYDCEYSLIVKHLIRRFEERTKIGRRPIQKGEYHS